MKVIQRAISSTGPTSFSRRPGAVPAPQGPHLAGSRPETCARCPRASSRSHLGEEVTYGLTDRSAATRPTLARENVTAPAGGRPQVAVLGLGADAVRACALGGGSTHRRWSWCNIPLLRPLPRRVCRIFVVDRGLGSVPTVSTGTVAGAYGVRKSRPLLSCLRQERSRRFICGTSCSPSRRRRT